MASIENRTGYFNIVFWFGGKKFTRSLKTKNKSEAERRKDRLEETIRLVESGRLSIPPEADIPTFLLSDGIHEKKIEVSDRYSLPNLFDDFFASLPANNLENSTTNTMQVHKRHIYRLLGERLMVDELNHPLLQEYVGKRSKEGGRRGNPVSPTTIKKEIATLRTVWNWGCDHDKLNCEFPRKRLRFDKTSQKPPFQTWKEIERQIKRGGLNEVEQGEMWECLYLSMKEIEQLLKYVQKKAMQPWLYPMIVMAAHTGARRSELLRSEIYDFNDDIVVIRERKRLQREHTTRRVPMSSKLRAVMADWLSDHPGGKFTFCQSGVNRSKKTRETPEPITRDEANDHFKRTLRSGKWDKIKGWHCLRHSFISNLASQGVDQRMIDEFVGHSTEAMRRRYRHLFPETKAAAIQQVFG